MANAYYPLELDGVEDWHGRHEATTGNHFLVYFVNKTTFERKKFYLSMSEMKDKSDLEIAIMIHAAFDAAETLPPYIEVE